MDNLAYIDDRNIKIKTELIDGKIFMMSPRPRVEHATVCTNIASEFRSYLKGKTCRAFCDGVDVFLDENNRFVPDTMIVCNPDIIKHDGIHGAPDLVVEVLSKTTAKNDRSKKKYTYAKYGVKEYWIVDIWSKSVEVYYNQDSWFILDNIYYYLTDEEIAENNNMSDNDIDKIKEYTDSIKVSICDNLIVKLKDIFEYI
ncbi:Uma2 family endonuclease [Megamonas rupellensis]|uniref:Uma2 family endonuclease n=1 Tax=Megamonas rupellensis TaxID=491921 RepID=A0A411ZZZ2_9FIRM|nr:Uma2 family endonuclease [Megamonas rupellensis]RGQ08385.1 Uma2 family endonuclease [Megamonas rupellensis]